MVTTKCCPCKQKQAAWKSVSISREHALHKPAKANYMCNRQILALQAAKPFFSEQMM